MPWNKGWILSSFQLGWNFSVGPRSGRAVTVGERTSLFGRKASWHSSRRFPSRERPPLCSAPRLLLAAASKGPSFSPAEEREEGGRHRGPGCSAPPPAAPALAPPASPLRAPSRPFPGGAGHPPGNRPWLSELQARQQRGPRAASAGQRPGTDPP